MVGHITVLALATIPGLHYDLVRARCDGVRARAGRPPQFGRVVIAGTLITTAALVMLGVLGLLGPGSLVDLRALVEDRAGLLGSPVVGAWSVACFLTLSLTISSLAVAVLTRLERRPGSFPGTARPAVRPGFERRADYTDRDVELEVTLSSGRTYRGVLADESAGRGYDVRFITLCGPIFELDGHGKPLPLDALHWDQMVVPTRAVTSVLLRPVEEPPIPPQTVLRGVQSRHSAPRLKLTDRLTIMIEQCYENRFSPRVLARFLGAQIVLIAAVGALANTL